MSVAQMSSEPELLKLPLSTVKDASPPSPLIVRSCSMNLPLKPPTAVHSLSSLLGMLGSAEQRRRCRQLDDQALQDKLGGARKPPVRNSSQSLHSVWQDSRNVPHDPGAVLTPGGQRPLSAQNTALAFEIMRRCMPEIFSLLWKLHPLRVMIMVALDVFRGVFPAFRGYSQALIINELQTVIASGNYSCARLCRLIATDLLRMLLEGMIDSFANANADIVQSSARFVMEYRQMEQRVKMDVPTLGDPQIRDLFQESDLFVRSFSGVSSFGLLSPLDFLRILTLLSELATHIWVLWTLAFGGTQPVLLLFSILSAVLPLVLSAWHRNPSYLETRRDMKEARATAKQNRMRNMAHSDTHRPEIVLFGLGPWILQTWAKARKVTLGLEQLQFATEESFLSSLWSQVNMTGLVSALQNIPVLIAVQSSSTSLGSFSLYRNSVQSLFSTVRQLIQTLRMGFQGIFLMGAFCTAMEVKPHLQPKDDSVVRYRRTGKGTRIEARNLSYTYPGSYKPALQNVSFTLEAGETLAIVGYNGSGKSTLARILLRLSDFDGGELLVNGCDIRRHDPVDFHKHAAAVLQGFSKFEASLRENVGIGYVPEVTSGLAIEKAVKLAGATHILKSLPDGVKTILDTSASNDWSPLGDDFMPHDCPKHRRHGLSGGEWQRIAISRAFMRAHRPEVELIVLDEPTSSLDAHAQNRVFETVEQMSRSPSGQRTKTVVFITHRLSTARRADKIAMMESGMIIEFGTHQELLDRGGAYAALYQASV